MIHKVGWRFKMEVGRDNLLINLDKLKINFKNLSGAILYVQDASCSVDDF